MRDVNFPGKIKNEIKIKKWLTKCPVSCIINIVLERYANKEAQSFINAIVA